MLKHSFSYLCRVLVPGVLLLAGGVMVASCSESAPVSPEDRLFEIPDGEEDSFDGVGMMENLSPGEQALYLGDMQYVRSLARGHTSIVLNHADERQHRFVLARLKLAGKTTENSPELFRMIEALRVSHLQKPPSAPNGAFLITGPQNMHFIGSANITSGTSMEGVAVGSSPETLNYGYNDVCASDPNGVLLGSCKYVEVYTNMPYKGVKTIGNLTLTAQKDYFVDSMLVLDSVATGYKTTYVVKKTSSRPTITPTSTAPVDIVGGDSKALVCLSRGGTNCDYSMLGMWELKLPLQGQAQISSNGPSTYTFDWNKILQYRAGTALDDNGYPDPGGSIAVVLKNTGGGCAMNTTANYPLPMQMFWNSVTLSADKKILYWTMPPANPANFGSGCQLIQDSVELNMTVTLPYIDNNNFTGITSISVTNNPNAATKLVPPIQITNSCFAAGTLIEMGSGWPLPIEEIQSGDLVSNPFDLRDFSLAVTDTIQGVEHSPMVRIEDERGKMLLVTENHPIDVVGRGMVMAKLLKTGDLVTTKDGPSRLRSVSRETYKGTVYNLKVGSQAEMETLGKDQTTIYANGFLVGDAQIQGEHESAELREKSKSKGISTRWRQDFLNSAKR